MAACPITVRSPQAQKGFMLSILRKIWPASFTVGKVAGQDDLPPPMAMTQARRVDDDPGRSVRGKVDPGHCMS